VAGLGKGEPGPTQPTGRKRWIRRADIHRQEMVSKPWQALVRAELIFARAQCEVALVPIASPADLHGMAVASAKFDGVEFARNNRAPIGLMVANEIVFGKAGSHEHGYQRGSENSPCE
jgi:hypothetical protein